MTSLHTETSSDSEVDLVIMHAQVVACAAVVIGVLVCLVGGAIAQMLVKRWCYDRGRKSMLPLQAKDEDRVVEDGREFHLVPVSAPTSLTELVQDTEDEFTILEE
jgi:hypothetical protein